MKKLLLIFALAIPAMAQVTQGTGVSGNQIKIDAVAPTPPTNGILMLKVGEHLYPVVIDMTTHSLTVSGNTYRLAAVVPATVFTPPTLEVTAATMTMPTLTLTNTPIPGTLVIQVGGLTLSETYDYTYNATTKVVTFVAGKEPTDGAIVRAVYQK